MKRYTIGKTSKEGSPLWVMTSYDSKPRINGGGTLSNPREEATFRAETIARSCCVALNKAEKVTASHFRMGG